MKIFATIVSYKLHSVLILVLWFLTFAKSHAQWTTATLSQARSNLSATSVGTKVFFAGGLGLSANSYSNVVDIYDNSTNLWSTATLSQARADLSAASVGTKIFFAGGSCYTCAGDFTSKVVDIYDNSSNTWSTATLSQGRYRLSAASVGTKVFFAGGYSGSGRSNVVDIYDNATNTWTTATLSQARDFLSAASVGTKVIFAGGRNSSGVASNVVDIYDNATNTWTTATLSLDRDRLSATSVGTKVFCVGGYSSSTFTNSNVVDTYDNSTNTWTTATLSQGRIYISATSVGTKVLFGGGSPVGTSNVVDIYNNATNTWTTATLSQGRDQLSATSIGTKVFFAGGYSSGPAVSNVVDIYNDDVTAPTIASFTPTSGGVGTSVTITGTNFDINPANNIVYFGASKASVAAATATQLTVTVPVGATHQPIIVVVGGLVAYSATSFIPTFSGQAVLNNTFTYRETFASGTTPYWVGMGDLDGDGLADLTVANNASNNISVYRNLSTGVGNISFANSDYDAGTTPNSVAVGDLDADGKLDIAVTNMGSNSISLFRNASTGPGNVSFDAKVDLTTGASPYSVVIGDLDKDGKADLVVGNNLGNSVSIFRNTSIGAGNISFDTKTDFTTGAYPKHVVIGDFDQDGKDDLAVVNQFDGTVSILQNTSSGPGSISYAAKVDFTAGTNPEHVAVGDLDADGKADLVVANFSSNNISVFRNTSTGSGNINFSNKINFTSGGYTYSTAIGDLDGDGKLDLAVGHYGNTGPGPQLYRNISSGSGNINFDTPVYVESGPSPQSVAIGDLDGDGMPELITANEGNNFLPTSYISVSRKVLLPPTIASFTPSIGAIGTTVTITGTNFDTTPTNNIVKFNGTTATITGTNTAMSIVTTVPAGASTGPITVQVGAQTANSATNFTVLAPEPTAQPTNLLITNQASTAFTVNFMAASGNPDGYIAFMKEGSSPSFVPQDGTTYIFNEEPDPAGDAGTFTVLNDVFTSFGIQSVTPGATLYFDIYSYNGSGSEINYLTSTTPLEGSFTTPALPTEPSTQASNLVITQPFASVINVSWTNGNGSGRIVVAKQDGAVDQGPVDGVTYAASSSFTNGDDLGGGNYVVYNGTGNSVSVTEIQASTSYQFFVFEYNGSAGSENYNISTATNNPKSNSTVSVVTDLSIPYSSFGSREANYRIIAVPLNLTNNKVRDVFDELIPYDDTRWRMFHYQNGSNQEMNESSTISPGQGYWLIVKESKTFTSGPGETVQAPFSVQLVQGWNQIGNPYDFNISWADVQAANPGLPGLRKWINTMTDGTTLSKMEGGFVNATTAGTLIIPAIDNGGRVRSEEELVRNTLDSPNWQVYLNVDQGELMNRIAGIGMNAKASDDYDIYDGLSMPHFFDSFLEVNHAKAWNGNLFSKDIVTTSQNHIWDFSVSTSGPEEVMTFSWDNSYFGDNDRELYLYDVALQRNIDMRTASTYAFNRNASNAFQVLFGSADFIKEKSSVNELVLHKTWPNPADQEINVAFSLPETGQDQTVNLELVDLMGKKIRSQEDLYPSGYHELKWQRNKEHASGVYLVVIKAGRAIKQMKVVLK
ncbi:MAG TPA: FG-GAP-like repeat-containing protein [Cyclobacteriaceae bacterium]